MLQPIPLNLLLDHTTHQELQILRRIKTIKSLWINWTYKDLSKALHISHTTLRKHVKTLLRLGWLRIEGNTLICTANKKLRIAKSKNGVEYKAPCVMLKFTTSKKEAILQFRSTIISHNAKQQERALNLNRATDNKLQTADGKLTKAEVRRIKLAGGAQKFSGSIQEVNISNKTFGRLIGRSLSTGKKLQKQLNESGVIISQLRLKLIASNVSRLEWLYNYLPMGKGLIYCEKYKSVKQRLSNAITLC